MKFVLLSLVIAIGLVCDADAKGKKKSGKGKKAATPEVLTLKGSFLKTGKDVKFVPVPGTKHKGKMVWSFKLETGKLNAYLKKHAKKGQPKSVKDLSEKKRYQLKIRAVPRVVGDGINLKPQKPGDHQILGLTAVK